MNGRIRVALMSAGAALTPGCASLNILNGRNKIPEASLLTCWRLQTRRQNIC